MRIKVRALRPFKESLEGGVLEQERPDGMTLEGLVRALCDEHPAFAEQALEDDGSIALTLNIMLSGRPVGEGDLGRELADGDEVLLFMPLSGG